MFGNLEEKDLEGAVEALLFVSGDPVSTLTMADALEVEPAQVEAACASLPYHVDVRLIENRGRDVSALLVGVKDVIMDYDLVCFIHDKKVTQLSPYSKGDGFAVKCFGNLLASREFVTNVIGTFEEEPRLGLLTPTPPNHADYFPIYTFAWGPNFGRTRKLLRELGIDVPLDDRKEPIAPLGTIDAGRLPVDTAAWVALP